MATEVVMPKLGMAMKEGTVSVWNKKVGDAVSKGEPIADINSEKIEKEIESPADGVILDIRVQEEQGVPPGTAICYIGNPDEKVPENKKSSSNPSSSKEEISATVAVEKENEAVPSTKKPKKGSVKISPVARKMAQTAGLNIEEIEGTGPKGRITKSDVEKAIADQSSSEPVTPKEETKDMTVNKAESPEQLPVTGMRKVIASRMKDSLLNSAQLTMTMKVDVTDLIDMQKQMMDTVQKSHNTKLTLTDFVARAVILSLQQHRQMNSAYSEDKIHIFNHVNLGMAVALDKGLVVPVVRHAENLSLIDLSKNIKSLAREARLGQLGNDQMKGSTFTITNLGAYGVEHFTPILNTPETGILGVGATEDTPVYKGEELQRRSLLPLSLTFDHRVLDGAPAAEFLSTIKNYLEEPFRILL